MPLVGVSMIDLRGFRPLHGWRALAGEIGIIVVGVLLALAAEQMTRGWQERREAAQVRSSLGSEIAETVQLVRERELLAPCLAKRFRDIASILDSASETGRLPPVGFLGQPSARSYDLPSWTALTTSGLGSLLTREDVLAYSQLASAGTEATDLNRAEMINWADLYALVGPGRTISSDEIGDLRRSLSEAAYRAKLVRLWGLTILEVVERSHLPLDRQRSAAAKRDFEKSRAKVGRLAICQPLGNAPSAYGHAPSTTTALMAS